MGAKEKIIRACYYIFPFLCFLPFVNAPIALAAGILISFIRQNVRPMETTQLTKRILQVSIILMGFGMNLTEVIQTSQTGILLTVITVFFTVVCGLILGKLLKVDGNIALLISSGTAICGGSAIAVISPIIEAKHYQIAFALTVVFILNSVALFLFPYIGSQLHLSQEMFGYWAAIAIHDTSSVIGASSAYGDEALKIATTVKLTRMLWIIPLAIGIALVNKQQHVNKIQIPWFICFFLAAIIIAHFITAWEPLYTYLGFLGKKGMTIALFFVGLSFSKQDIQKLGLPSFFLGIILWILISVMSCIWIMH